MGNLNVLNAIPYLARAWLQMERVAWALWQLAHDLYENELGSTIVKVHPDRTGAEAASWR
jgi:hypothetical protein